MLRPTLFLFVIASVLSGCASQSKAVFQQAPVQADSDLVIQNAASGGDLFAMPTSKMVVSKVSTQPTAPVGAGGAAQPKNQGQGNAANQAPTPTEQKNAPSSSASPITVGKTVFNVSVVPVESSHKYLINPVNNFFNSTQVNITKIPNTDVPSVVSGQFTDNTSSRIDEIGGLITAAVAFLPFLAAQNTKEQDCQLHPQALQPFTLILDTAGTDLSPLSGQDCWNYLVTFDSKTPSAGAVSWNRFAQDLGTSVSYFPVPACRDATVILDGYVASTKPGTPSDHVRVSIHTEIADPQYLRLAPLPSKGAVTMHPICGADATDTSPDRFAAYMNDVTEVLKQAKAIETAGKKPSK